MKNIIKKASELRKKMVVKTRQNGEKFYSFRSYTEETSNFARDVHEGIAPDDFIYKQINLALNFIADFSEEDDFYDRLLEISPDSLTSDLTSWLNSSNYRLYYLTEAIGESDNGFDLLAMAQLKEIQKIYTKVFEELENLKEELED